MKLYLLLALCLVSFTALADVPDEITTSYQDETESPVAKTAGMFINCDDLHRNTVGSRIRMRPLGIPPEGMSLTEYGSLFKFLCSESGVGQVINKQAVN